MKHERIMIVEDDGVLIEYLQAALANMGYRVGPAIHSGEEAVTAAGGERPDLILMDIFLKGTMDGMAASETIHRRFDIPIVFLTSDESDERIQQAQRTGAYGYLLKPFDERILYATVEMALYRHRMEKELKESEERYRTIMEEMEEGYYETDTAGNFTFINDAMSRIIGSPKEELIGTNNRDFMDPETAKESYQKYSEVYRTGIPIKEFFYEWKNKDGRSRDLEVFISLMKDKGGKPVGFRGITRDITDKRKTEIQLIKTRNFLQNILNSSIDGVITTDLRGKIVYATPRLVEMIGFDQKSLIGKKVEVFYKNKKEDAKGIMKELMEKGEIKAHEMQFLKNDGTLIDAILSATLLRDESGKVVGTLGIFKDITDKKRLEEQVQQSQKLESIGILAGGIAHDFNNLLTAILGNISLAKMYSKTEGKAHQLLLESERACGRAKELTERLITFSRGGKPIKRVASVDQLIRDTTSLVLMGSSISCEFQIPKELWLVEYNTAQFKQLFSNITTNAKEAMPKGGTLKVIAKNTTVDRKRNELPEGMWLGKYVQISFQDQGVGISRTNLPKVFDPYFSTKEMGSQRGVGLGLTAAYSIVKKHDGFITVESREGAGATIHLYFPAFEEKQRDISEGLEKGYDDKERVKGKILFMDDEEIVREVVGEMLRQIGYSVKFAKDGSEAIELYQKAKGAGHPFQGVILDVTVRAGMGAKETIKRLKEIDPDISAFVSSGYSDEPIMIDFDKYGFKGSLSKPFNVIQLQQILTQI
ncbi:MAG: hypothetical protein A2V65_04310 [Deltaproteobacteria bacterium RBG_13_49_15]|nr:MAG: hypothetical protein A2V65_04310 [Deltaproteobacteria bacterium RBG_13_49_15]